MMLRQFSIGLFGAGALIAACPALVAAADVQAEPAAALEAVVVTGTRIRAPNLASESPVTAVSDEDIKDQGATNIESVLDELPQKSLLAFARRCFETGWMHQVGGWHARCFSTQDRKGSETSDACGRK